MFEKKRICQLVDFAVPPHYRVKIKVSENIELKKNCWKRLTVIPVIVGVLGAVPKGLEKRLGELEIRERIENIHTIAL